MSKDYYNNLDFYKCIYLHRIKKYASSQKIILEKKLLSNFLLIIKKYLFDYLIFSQRIMRDWVITKKAFETILERNELIIEVNKNKKFDKKIINDTLEKYTKFYNKTNFRNIFIIATCR